MKTKRRRINGISINYIFNLRNITDNSSNSRLQREVTAGQAKKKLKIKGGGLWDVVLNVFRVWGSYCRDNCRNKICMQRSSTLNEASSGGGNSAIRECVSV